MVVRTSGVRRSAGSAFASDLIPWAGLGKRAKSSHVAASITASHLVGQAWEEGWALLRRGHALTVGAWHVLSVLVLGTIRSIKHAGVSTVSI